MAKIAKKARRYPFSDLTEEEWERVAPADSHAAAAGSPARDGVSRGVERGALLGAFGRWLADASVHFRPWQTVYCWFRRFARLFLFRTIHDLALMVDRERPAAKRALRRP